MSQKIDNYLKGRIALAALKGEETPEQIALKNGISIIQVEEWKQILLNNASNVFETSAIKTSTNYIIWEEIKFYISCSIMLICSLGWLLMFFGLPKVKSPDTILSIVAVVFSFSILLCYVFGGKKLSISRKTLAFTFFSTTVVLLIIHWTIIFGMFLSFTY